MSKVKVELAKGPQHFVYISVDGKPVCSTPYVSNLEEIKRLLELVFEAMDIENVEVVIK